MNELTQQENINSNVAVFSPQSLAAIQTFSQVMASGMATVPEHLREIHQTAWPSPCRRCSGK
ncbi:Uncharacterised protein [Escherichia coli]|nr:Uncharacterised protein [Escherichia coli]